MEVSVSYGDPAHGSPAGPLAGAYVPRKYNYGAARRTPRRRFWLEFAVVRSDDPDLQFEDDPSIVTTPSSFPQFSRLPAEIRIQIWELVLRQPRIVAITCRSADYVPRSGTLLDPLAPRAPLRDPSDPSSFSLPSLPPPPPAWKPPPAELPALMTVCRESYAIAENYYERAFGWRVPYVLVDDDDDDDELEAGYHSSASLSFGAPTDGGATDSLPPLASILGSRYRGRLSGPRPKVRPSGAGCWFNFDHDAVLLRGELEPCQEAASTSMVYFMARQDTIRVRQVACSASDLGVGDLLASQLYARLFPIIDRFGIKDQLVVVAPRRQRARRAAAADEASGTGGSSGSGSGSGNAHAHALSTTEASIVTANGDDEDDDMNGPGSYDVSNNICQQVWDRWTNSQNMPLLTVEGIVGVVQPAGHAPEPGMIIDDGGGGEEGLEDGDEDGDDSGIDGDLDVDHNHGHHDGNHGFGGGGWPLTGDASLLQTLYYSEGTDDHHMDGHHHDHDHATFIDSMRIVMVAEDMLAQAIARLEPYNAG